MSKLSFSPFSKSTAKYALVLMFASMLAACGGGDGDVVGSSNTSSAVHCVSSSTSTTGATIFNSCSETVIVLTDVNARFVLTSGQSAFIPTAQMGSGFAACFSPNEPAFTGSGVFTCGGV